MASRVLVVCKADRQLVSLDPDSLVVRWRAELSDLGHEVVASPDGTLGYVPLYGTGGVGRPGRSGDAVDVIDLSDGTRVETIPLPPGCRPHFADWGHDGRLLVTAEGLYSVLSVDVSASRSRSDDHSDPPVRELRTDHDQTHMLAVARDRTRVYTANVSPGSVTELHFDAARCRSLELTHRINRISVSPDDRWAYVADQDEPRLAVVGIRTMTLDRWIDLPSVAFGTAALNDGRLVVTMRDAGEVAVLDLRSGQMTARVAVPDGPQRVVVEAGGRTAYVTCPPADTVVAIDLAALEVRTKCSPGRDPDGLALGGASGDLPVR